MADGIRIGRNMKAIASAQIITVVLGQVVILVLASLLDPSDFGVYALCVTVFNIATLISTLGLDSAAIFFQDVSEASIRTASSARFALAAGATLVTILSAPFLSDAVGMKDLTTPLRIAALSVFVYAFGFGSVTRLSRAMNFGTIAIGRTANILTWSMLSLTLAFMGFGLWSLVIAMLAGITANVAVLMAASSFRIEIGFDKKLLRRLMGYGFYSMATSLVAMLAWNVDKLCVGWILGSASLGLYWMAFSYGTVIPNIVAGAVTTVLFPAFSKMRSDVASLRSRYLDTFESVCWVSIPLGALIAVESRPLVSLFLGVEWDGAVLPLAIISLLGVLQSLTSPAASVFLGTGTPNLMFRQTAVLAVPFFLMLVPSILIGGLEGLATLSLCISLASFVWVSRLVSEVLAMSIRSLMKPIVAPAASAALLVVVGLALQAVIPPSRLTFLLQLALSLIAYALVLNFLTHGRFYSRIKSLLVKEADSG